MRVRQVKDGERGSVVSGSCTHQVGDAREVQSAERSIENDSRILAGSR